MIKSNRGFPIVISSNARPLVTVEFYTKWYSLFVLDERDQLTSIAFNVLDGLFPDGASAVDHVPNPKFVRAFAEQLSATLDPLAEELIVGRWSLEVLNKPWFEPMMTRTRATKRMRDAANCTCYYGCGEDSLSETWHQHDDDPCPVHPNAPRVG